MPATPLDSAVYRDLLGDPEVARLFSDAAEVRALLLVEGALAQAQGAVGLIPEISAAAIHRASLEAQIDPSALADETGRSGVVVPALVAAFRAAIPAAEHAQYVHWGATSQDVIDTALVLRLRQILVVLERRLEATLAALGVLAEAHAELPMAARTYGMSATPTSFGAVVAAWGQPLLGCRAKLEVVRGDLLHVSLSGAAGTLSAMGDTGPKVRAKLAQALGLKDPGGSWHSTRDTVASLASWLTLVTGSLGKLGEDVTLMTQSGIGEIAILKAGGSSTMPQKSNPILPSLLVAIARQVVGLNSVMQGAVIHRQQRDGTAWFAEWLSLPQMCCLAGRALAVAEELARTVAPIPERMAAQVDDGTGLIFSEALSFALTDRMSRPDAQAMVKALCTEARETGLHLRQLLERDFKGDFTAVFDPSKQLGQAPAEARSFAAAARGA